MDGHTVTESEFLNEMQNYSNLTFIKDWWIDFSIDDETIELYDLLSYLQKAAQISPDTAPLLSTDNAESIAYSFWEKYLKYEGYKIVPEESVIKDGVMYYRFTLQTNNFAYTDKFADNWSVFQTVFINSLTGDCSDSLY